MNTKIIILIFFLFCFHVISCGQKNSLGIKGGVSYTSIINSKNYNFFVNAEPKAGFAGGFLYEYTAKPWLSFQIDLLYQQFGCNNLEAYAENNYLLHPTVLFQFDYVSFPVKVKFSTTQSFYGFCSVGICPSILVNSDPHSPYLSNKDNSTDIAWLSSTDFAVIGELGLGYKFKNGFHIFASEVFQCSFTNAGRSDFWGSKNPFYNYGWISSIGCKYSF